MGNLFQFRIAVIGITWNEIGNHESHGGNGGDSERVEEVQEKVLDEQNKNKIKERNNQ